MRRLIIVGAGGHGRAVAEAVEAMGGFTIAGFVDDAYPQLDKVWEIPVLGKPGELSRWRETAACAVVAIGNNALRKQMAGRAETAGFALATIIHPHASVSPRARIGDGSMVMAGTVVGSGAMLGRGVIVNCGAVADHDCHVGDFAHLGVNAAMAGGSMLGEGAWMQAGAVLGYGVKIAAGHILALGEAVCQ